MVASVGADCSEARVLRGVSIVPSTALARNKKTPVTSCMNFFPALSNVGVLLSSLANCSFAPYFFFTWGWGLFCQNRGEGGVGNVLGPSVRMLALRGAPCAYRSPI